MDNMENDKLTQLHVNTKNIGALVGQLKVLQAEQQVNVDKIHTLQGQIAMMAAEMAQLKQTVMVLKVMSMGHGPTQ
jgi:cell division protein FtsB